MIVCIHSKVRSLVCRKQLTVILEKYWLFVLIQLGALENSIADLIARKIHDIVSTA